MKAALILGLVALAQCAYGHYIFNVLIAGSKTSTQAVRQPKGVDPFAGVDSADMTCNVNPSPATDTVSVAAGETIGYKLSNSMYHQGPVSLYLGKAPGSAASWDGSGQNWFKIAEWGVDTLKPVSFSSYQKSEFTATIPPNTPSGEYLVRIEQIALHLGTGVPEVFVSCAQINVTNGGSGNPPKVSIPGHIPPSDPGVTANIYEGLSSYTVPGPAVWRG
ncbi:hypothetical protein CC1G_10604 [Coprinopsis cinerea okayama7|uniref:AA9 family lytic polysaccharide monooxygenase n=1 Tax=Coprinopsis cinerea (strain Okayama-7 / 130 / ATCC MYA-4618 / FGSC 9003) TaxID=240176 RepID=A8P8P6_COPC7|nr:hypothetical protein CC1G_10604 [Coprinopsis cinerea okayama7\|eukprot:XP_001839611.1 hypothetical protein CC1G_10604 [Coprinopsis cinerea okayama7\